MLKLGLTGFHEVEQWTHTLAFLYTDAVYTHIKLTLALSNLSWAVHCLCCASRPHIHTAVLYCSFHCGNGNRVNVARRGRKRWPKAVGSRPCMALPWLASLSTHTQTHTHLHIYIAAHNLSFSPSWDLTHTYTRELCKPHCSENTHHPCIPSNGRKSWTCRAHLEKYLRFWRNWDHLISE